MDNKVFVTIVVPCRNEEKYIANCLNSIIASDYPKEHLEVLVIDGMSCDGSRVIVENYVKQNHYIRLLENHKKITPTAFNLGIKQAKGNVIVIMSAHATYDEKYLSLCIKYLDEYKADNVGGIMLTKSRNNTIIENVIIEALSHPFGVGNSVFRTGSDKVQWVDTVFGGCYKREIFEKIGPFNESLERTQDMEFNRRLQKSGGKILFVPDIVSYYYPRTNLLTFCMNNFSNGYWVTYPFKFTSIIPVSWRHFIPMVFVMSITTSIILSLFSNKGSLMFGLILGSYLVMNLISSCNIAIKKKKLYYLVLMPLLFFSLHFLYGVGSIWGSFKLIDLSRFWKSFRKGGV